MQNPSVSIIITCYNYGRFVSNAIASALDQSYKNVEVVVVNDGSTDHSHDVISQFGDRITYINQPNLGAASARNAGICRAQGAWVVPLDGDDWISPDYIADAVQLIDDYKTVVFARFYYADSDLNLINRYHPCIMTSNEQILEACKLQNISAGNAMPPTSLYSKELWNLCGGYNEHFLRAEDWEYNVNMISHGANVKFMNFCEPYVKYRQHGGGKSTRNQTLLEHTRRYIRQRYT